MPGACVKLAGNCSIPVISLVRAGESICESTRWYKSFLISKYFERGYARNVISTLMVFAELNYRHIEIYYAIIGTLVTIPSQLRVFSILIWCSGSIRFHLQRTQLHWNKHDRSKIYNPYLNDMYILIFNHARY